MVSKGWLSKAALATVLAFLAPTGTRADDAQLQEIRTAWSACDSVITRQPEAWIGWRRDFFNGYGDQFNFWNNVGSEPKTPSVLRTIRGIDAIAVLTTTYCFRGDDTLAFILTIMASPNAVDGPDHNKPVRREGRIYIGRDGGILKVSGQVVDDQGKPHPLDNPDWQLMRGCPKIALFRTVADVEKAYVAELGDIEGNRPIFTPSELDWCANATKP